MRRVNVMMTNEDYKSNEFGYPTFAGWFDLDAAEGFAENRRHDGQNFRGVISGGQIGSETLYRTAGGRWVHNSDFRNEFNGPDIYTFYTDEQACDWLHRAELHDDAIEKYFGEVQDERGPGRPEVGPAIQVRLPVDLLEKLDEMATALEISRAVLVRHLLAEAVKLIEQTEVTSA